MAEELGFTLQEAIERYADVEKWQAYQKAANDVAELQCRTGSMSFALRPLREWDDDSGPTQYDTLERVRQHAEQAVVRDLWMRRTSEAWPICRAMTSATVAGSEHDMATTSCLRTAQVGSIGTARDGANHRLSGRRKLRSERTRLSKRSNEKLMRFSLISMMP